MTCFKNGEAHENCISCALRYSANGALIGKNIPDMDVYKRSLTITFKEKVIAKEFAKYFGFLQERILLLDAEQEIVIDFTNTIYINHFCISKLLVTLYKVRKEKKVVFRFPVQSSNNKMLRFLYNLGILDFIFKDDYFESWIGNVKIESYGDMYNFNECYDYAIFPYTIYDEEIIEDNSRIVEKIVDNILSAIEGYYSTRNQIEKYRQIESRVHLYLVEIIDNVFQHAYAKCVNKRAIFAVNVYNSYLPPYKVLMGTPEEVKFENRIERLQREVPMSVYKDIHDRFFGGFNILVDDIGESIQATYESSSLENVYKDVYLNGSNKRKTINGLKLVADQVATNCDLLWAHDGRSWISTSFVENSSIRKSDESETRHYSHPAIKGLTYDLFINLAKNSKEKKRTYEEFGSKITFSLEEIRDITSNSYSIDNARNVFVDLLNILNKNKSFGPVLDIAGENLFYRPRATQKNKMSNEIETRVIDKFSNDSSFTRLIVYDLNQTTLFQIKAVFESKEIASKLIEKGIRKIILLTEECWLFSMCIVGEIFVMKKEETQHFHRNDIKDIFAAIHKNDSKSLKENLQDNISKYLCKGKIIWGFREINEYIDIEKMIIDRAISDLVRKSISRISGMLSEDKKVVFLDKFMEMPFVSLVNEYKDRANQNVYLGSIILSGETEKRVAGESDIKIYLFKHQECTVELNNNHLILFSLPDASYKKNTSIYRRILNTNRIEECSEQSEEYKYYLSNAYEENIKKLEYVLGFFSMGFFSIKKNSLLYKGYLDFVLSIIRIKLRKFDVISLSLGINFLQEQDRTYLKNEINKIEKDTEFRHLGKKVHFENITDTSTQLIMKLGENLDLIDMMTDMNHSKNEVVYLPMFSNIQFESNFSKVVDAGYMPYIPLLYTEKEFFITDVKLEKFYSFARTLNPHYRRELEVSRKNGEALRMYVDFTNEVYTFYDYLSRTDYISGTILWDVVNMNIKGVMYKKIDQGLIKGQYLIFIYAVILQHSIVKLCSEEKTKIVDTILNFFYEYHEKIEDSIITYLLLIIIKSISIDEKLLERLFEKEVGKELLHCKSKQISILFADLYNENCRHKFEAELNEFFVSNDIAIYYNMLAQLLFNSHGVIHDSKLDTIYKKLIEHVEDITEQDINDISSIIPNCVSLLKLTKSYDRSTKKEEQLEQDFLLYADDIRSHLQNIRTIIEGLTECAKERFEIISKEDVQEGIIRYYDQIKDVLTRKKYNIEKTEISNLNVRISEDCEMNEKGHIKRNINLYKDTLIFEELAYLLHNAHSHSYKPFSLFGNEDKKYLVWVKAELHANCIRLRLFNSIEKKENNYNKIVTAIQDKKRIGKTYLEKFNIHVVYYENPKGIEVGVQNVDVFETRIEIPYFT